MHVKTKLLVTKLEMTRNVVARACKHIEIGTQIISFYFKAPFVHIPPS